MGGTDKESKYLRIEGAGVSNLDVSGVNERVLCLGHLCREQTVHHVTSSPPLWHVSYFSSLTVYLPKHAWKHYP